MTRSRSRLTRAVVAAFAAVSVLPATTVSGRAAEAIELAIDIAHVLRLDRPAGTVIIGNPNIADATILDARTFVLTGKSAGTTNLIVLDQDGGAVSDFALSVSNGGGRFVSVRAGDRQRTFLCNGICESRPAGKGAQGAVPGDLASILALAALAAQDAEADPAPAEPAAAETDATPADDAVPAPPSE